MFYKKRMLWWYEVLILYALFAINRIKYKLLPSIDGKPLNNIIILALLVLVVLLIHRKKQKYPAVDVLSIIGIATFCILSVLRTDSVGQSLYACVFILLPMLIASNTPEIEKSDFLAFLNHMALYASVYAVITIIAVFRYAGLMQMIGNIYSAKSQVRASLPLGSSITVSYYLNLSLPILLYLHSRAEKKKKLLFLFGIILNVAATFLELSRSSVITTVAIIVLYYLFYKDRQRGGKFWIVFILAVMFMIIGQFADLSRITGLSSQLKDNSRFSAWNLALAIFREYPIYGSGIARYFHRLWHSNVLYVNNVKGIIDPHSTYLLLLSELGILGFAVYAFFFGKRIKCIFKLEDKGLVCTGALVVFTILFNGIAGSQLINEINYALIAYTVLAFFSMRKTN